MNKSQIIKWGFRTLCMIGLTVLLCTDVLIGQTRPQSKPKVASITDDNFKSKIAKGFVLVHFTAPYQMATLDKKLFEGIEKFEGCIIYKTDHSNVKKVAKKLRLRNYPSLALFHNGKKKEVWKADMDGKLDVTNRHIKKAISDALAGDVF
jgi:hypothetical protein